MEFTTIPGFAVEKSQIEFTGFWDWLVAVNDVCALWRAQPSYIFLQSLVLLGSLITLYHALKHKGRFIHLWIGIILHGLTIEIVCYNLPDIDNFWHSQTPIIFLGRRLPLYIILIYLTFIYPASVAVDKLNLPKWSEPFAVGLVTVIVDYPYDIMGVRLMHWTWHDTDPNISDKHYHVPWNSFYFHAAFTASFVFWFHFTRFVVFGKTNKWIADISNLKEFGCTVLAALLGMPGGVLLFIPLYHPLHDIYNIHSEVTLFLLLAIFLSIVWLSFPDAVKQIAETREETSDYFILLYMIIYYASFIGLAIFVDPAAQVSIGWHEPIGPCNENISMLTALGHVLQKRKYLCKTDNDETYFGWSCLPGGEPPKDGAKWYTICGTPWTNRMEYIVILTAIAIFGSSFFIKTLYFKNKFNDKSKINLQDKSKKRNCTKVKAN